MNDLETTEKQLFPDNEVWSDNKKLTEFVLSTFDNDLKFFDSLSESAKGNRNDNH